MGKLLSSLVSKEVYPHPVFSRGHSPPEESKRRQGKLNSI